MADYYFTFGPSGGAGGVTFSDYIVMQNFVNNKQDFSVSKLKIRHGTYIDSIQTCWRLSSGEEIWGQMHGGNGGREDIIELGPSEYIEGIDGYSHGIIHMLGIHTNTRMFIYGGTNGTVPYTYNPVEREEFSNEVIGGFGNIALVGFWGRSGLYLDAIGPIYRAKS